MTVANIIEQAKALSVQERKELTKLLIDTLDATAQSATQGDTVADNEPWGARLGRLLQQTEHAEWGDSTSADPVEALHAVRQQKAASPFQTPNLFAGCGSADTRILSLLSNDVEVCATNRVTLDAVFDDIAVDTGSLFRAVSQHPWPGAGRGRRMTGHAAPVAILVQQTGVQTRTTSY